MWCAFGLCVCVIAFSLLLLKLGFLFCFCLWDLLLLSLRLCDLRGKPRGELVFAFETLMLGPFGDLCVSEQVKSDYFY